MTEHDEKNAGFPAKYRGLPPLPAGREKAALKEWEEKTIAELAKQGLGDAVTAVYMDFDKIADTRLGDKVQKLYGLLMCAKEGPLREEPELLELMRERCAENPQLRLHGARLYVLLAKGVRVLPEPEEVGEARRLALRNLLHGGLTPTTTGSEVSAHLRKVKRAMADVPEETFSPKQWRDYLRRIVPPGSQARQRRAWELELIRLDAEAIAPLEGAALTMAFVRWWSTESNATALHNALPAIGGSASAKNEVSPDAALISEVLAAMKDEKRRRAAAAARESEPFEEEEGTWAPLEDESVEEDTMPEYLDLTSETLSAQKAVVCMCDFCGFVHVGGEAGRGSVEGGAGGDIAASAEAATVRAGGQASGSSAQCAGGSLTTPLGNGERAGDVSPHSVTPQDVGERTDGSAPLTMDGGSSTVESEGAVRADEGNLESLAEGYVAHTPFDQLAALREELARRDRRLESEVAMREEAQSRAWQQAARADEAKEEMRLALEAQRDQYEATLKEHLQQLKEEHQQWEAQQALRAAAQADRERAEAEVASSAADAAEQREALEETLKSERAAHACEKVALEDEVTRAKKQVEQQDSVLAATLGSGEENADKAVSESMVDQELARAVADAESAQHGLSPKQSDEVQEQILQENALNVTAGAGSSTIAAENGQKLGEKRTLLGLDQYVILQENAKSDAGTTQTPGAGQSGQKSSEKQSQPGLDMLRSICKSSGDESKFFEKRREALGVLFLLRRMEKYVMVAPRGLVYDRAVQVVGSMYVVENCLAEMLARPRAADRWVMEALPQSCSGKFYVHELRDKINSVKSRAWTVRVNDWELPALDLSDGKLPAPDLTCEDEYPELVACEAKSTGKVSSRASLRIRSGSQSKPKNEVLASKVASVEVPESQPTHTPIADEPPSCMLHLIEGEYAAYRRDDGVWVACTVRGVHHGGPGEAPSYSIQVEGEEHERSTEHSRLDYYARLGTNSEPHAVVGEEAARLREAHRREQVPSQWAPRSGARMKKPKNKRRATCGCAKCVSEESCTTCDTKSEAVESTWPDLVVSSQDELNAAIAAGRHIVRDGLGEVVGSRKVVLRASTQTRARSWARSLWDGWTLQAARVAAWAGPALVMLLLTATVALTAVAAGSLGAVSVQAASNAAVALRAGPSLVGAEHQVVWPANASGGRADVGAGSQVWSAPTGQAWAAPAGAHVGAAVELGGEGRSPTAVQRVQYDRVFGGEYSGERRDASWAVALAMLCVRVLSQLCQCIVELTVAGDLLGGARGAAWRALCWVGQHLNPVSVGLGVLQVCADVACIAGRLWLWSGSRLSARLRQLRRVPGGGVRLCATAALGMAVMLSCGDARRLDGSWSDVAEGVSRAHGAVAYHGEVYVHVASVGSAALDACSGGSYDALEAWRWAEDDKALRACTGKGSADSVGPSTRQQWVQQRVEVGTISNQTAAKIKWCMLDSGCSGVYCAPGTQLTDRTVCGPGRSKDQVYTANMMVEPLSKGTWEVLWLESGGEWQAVEFADAWEMPGFTSPLVSVGRMIEEAGCEICFSKGDGQCRVEVQGLTFPFPRCRKGVYTYNMAYLDQKDAALMDRSAASAAQAATVVEEPGAAELAGRYAAAAVRGAGAARPPEFSGQHAARGGGMPALNGMGLPAHMRKASWFAHLAFSHACGKRVTDAAKHAMTHLPSLNPAEMCDCEACTEANACKIHSNRHATVPEEWGHFVADECGPLPESWEGYKWALVMQECKTGYVFFVPMKSKGDTAKALAGVQRMIARMPGEKSIKSLRFDGDGSHRSEKVKSWALMDDVHLIMTRPYESNSNATAERCVHTMFCGIRANCVQAELDEGAWALAGMHTAQCYNMLGNAKTGPTSSPFVETFGYKPRGDNMRPFGSLMIVSNMSDIKSRPTMPTGERGIYVGTFDEFNSPDIDQVVGRSTCFAIKVGRRNELLYRANAKCFPTVFPGLPLSKASHPLRQVGPREDESEVHGVGARGGTRSGRRAASEPKTGAQDGGAAEASEDSDADLDGGADEEAREGNREEGVTRRALKNKSEKLSVGDRRLVPATVWPEYECKEHDGAGWEVELLGYRNGYWKVRFVSARWPNGEKYADEELKRRLLHPLPDDGTDESSAALASQWRAGLAEQAEDPLDDVGELWSTEQGALGLEADDELLSAMNVAARELQEEMSSAMSVEVGTSGPMPIGKALLLPNGEGAKVRQALDAELSTVIDDFHCLTPVLRGAPETEGFKEFHLGAHALHKAADSLKAARWKVRLFFNGSEEEKYVDYDDCSSPVKRSSAFRLMCGIAACNDASPSGRWLLEHSDQTGAFMHEDNDPVLARMPKALREYRVVDGTQREVMYWVRNLYGRHDAGRKFVIGHRKWFLDRGFTACTAEPCLFVRRDARGVAIVGVYVDDCAWLCSSEEVLEELKKEYRESYRAQFGELTSFLGIRVARDQEHGTVSTDLEHQIESLASKWLAGADGLKVMPSRPCDEKLMQLVSPMALEANPEPPEELRKRYMRLVGLLMYIAVTERFDVLYAVGLLARAPHRCTEELFERGLCVAAYLYGTKHFKTCYTGAAGVRLEACSDASHEEWGATSGNVAYVAGAAISGMSKRQRCKTLSTCESETVAASVCAAEVVSHRMTLEELGYEQKSPTAIFVDNIALAYLCRNTTLSNALKHVRRRFFFVKDVAEIGEIVVSWIDGKHNEADALTKALPEPRFRELTAMFRGRQPRMLRALMAGLRRLGWSRSMAVP